MNISQEGPATSILVLDLDKTLIFARVLSPDEEPSTPNTTDETLQFSLNGSSVYVTKRQHVDEFLHHVSQTFATVVIYSAGVSEYVDIIVDWLDPQQLFISKRLYRCSCKMRTGGLCKDLSAVTKHWRDRVVAIDDMPHVYRFQTNHCIGIPPFNGTVQDDYLHWLARALSSSQQVFNDATSIVYDISTKMTMINNYTPLCGV